MSDINKRECSVSRVFLSLGPLKIGVVPVSMTRQQAENDGFRNSTAHPLFIFEYYLFELFIQINYFAFVLVIVCS